MNTLYTFIFRAAFVLSLILSAGCAAVNYPQTIVAIDPAATLRGMQAAVNGQPGTYILQQGEHLVLGWPAGAKYAWVAFSQNGQFTDALKTLCANRACPELAGEMYNWLVKNGWQSIPAGMVPPAVASAVRQFAYMLSIGASLPVAPVLILPAMIDPQQWMNPQTGA